MRAPASDLLLFLYGRAGPSGAEVFGDASLLDALAASSCSGEPTAASSVGHDGGAQHVDHVLAAGRERVGRERIDVEQVRSSAGASERYESTAP